MSTVTINTTADYTFDIKPEIKKVFKNISTTGSSRLTASTSSLHGYYGNILEFVAYYTHPTKEENITLANGDTFEYTYKDESIIETAPQKLAVIKSGSNLYYYHTHNILPFLTAGDINYLDYEVQYPDEETGLTIGGTSAFFNDTNIRNEVIYVKNTDTEIVSVRVKITFPNGCTILQERPDIRSSTVTTKYFLNKSEIVNVPGGWGITYKIEKKVFNSVISDYEYVKETVNECLGPYSSAATCFASLVKEYSPVYADLFEYAMNSTSNPTDSGFNVCLGGSLCIRVYDYDAVREGEVLNTKYIDDMIGRISERWYYPLMSRSTNSTTLDNNVDIEMKVLTDTLAKILTIDRNSFENRTNRFKQMKGTVAFPQLQRVMERGMKEMFRGNEWLDTVSLPVLTTVDSYGMQNAFRDCYRLKDIDLNSLATVGEYGMQGCFENARAMETVTSADEWSESNGHSHTFTNLASVGKYGLYRAFANCENIKGVLTLPELGSGTLGEFSMYETFAGCKGLTEVYLPKVTEITGSNLYRCFAGCNKIRKVHLKSDIRICMGTPVVYDGSSWVEWDPTNPRAQKAKNWYDSEPTSPEQGDAYSPMNVPTEEQKTFSPTNTEYGYLQEFLCRYLGCKNAEILFDL